MKIATISACNSDDSTSAFPQGMQQEYFMSTSHFIKQNILKMCVQEFRCKFVLIASSRPLSKTSFFFFSCESGVGRNR